MGSRVGGDDVRAFDPIGDQVRSELARSGMTMSHLATDAEVQPQSIKDWLCGRRGLRSDRLARVLNALGLEVRARRDEKR